MCSALLEPPGEGRGPLRIEGSVASRDVDSSCGERIGALPGLEDLAITTNGLVLEKRLQQLRV